MVTKSRKEKKGQVKVGKLKVNRETVKNLTNGEQKHIQGGLRALTDTCAADCTVQTAYQKTCKCGGGSLTI